MAAKRHPLPRPCPKCGLEYGTIRLAFFRRCSVVRIGHYNAGVYKQPGTKRVDTGTNPMSDYEFTTVKNRGRVWCSSKICYPFSRMRVQGRLMNIENLLELGSFVTEVKPSRRFIAYVRANGWPTP